MSFLFDLFNHTQTAVTPGTDTTATSTLSGGNTEQASQQTIPTSSASKAFNPFSAIDDFVKGAINGVTNIANAIGRTVETIGQNIQQGIVNAENDLTRFFHQFQQPLTLDIGASNDPNLTHITFIGNGKPITDVSINLTVNSVSPEALKGLNFWALQVNWPNNTWAHGGPQTHIANSSQPWGNQVNWGGLVNKGGGSADYTDKNLAEDIYSIQNGPNRLAPYDWEVGKTYTLSVDRGNLVTLPPGTYNYGGDGEPVKVDNTRQMWEWTFTMKPADGSGPAYTSTMYNSASSIDSVLAWSESGYGSEGKAKSATFSNPQYTTADGTIHYYSSYYRS
ncbi:hypothetical protein [Entomobacter blattae]|uniref:Uncharacterized protein n=1 Tax=Entomobacter blattae TaxID=2762277 RepID=A0A7H1NRC0_9PROT|nr:hypothetical protein [Entomobacter blattae]QNT78330.1 hypothetical protein JGUZn3_11030 [Entomobacter blattae]